MNQEGDATHTLHFRSTFIGTYIIIEMKNGILEVKSDNLSVITIIKVSLFIFNQLFIGLTIIVSELEETLIGDELRYLGLLMAV